MLCNLSWTNSNEHKVRLLIYLANNEALYQARAREAERDRQQKEQAAAAWTSAIMSGDEKDRAMLVKLVSKRLIKAEATIGELTKTRVAWVE